MIHVCYALFDRDGTYSKFIGTSILSMFENTHEKITVHLIHDSTLTDDNRKKFMRLVYSYDQDIIFHNVEDRLDEIRKGCGVDRTRYSLAAMYRLLIPELFPKNVTRTIYLDSDIIVNLNINELWSVDMQNFPIAAMPESSTKRSQRLILTAKPVKDQVVDWQNYFNSGVLVFNFDSLQKMNGRLIEKCFEILKNNPDYRYHDQDSLNVLFNENYFKLPVKFNRFVSSCRNLALPVQKEILHYVANALSISMSDPFNNLWFKYFVKTPFCTEKSFENIFNIFDSIQKLNDEKNRLWTKILKLSATRQKIFFIDPNEKWILDLFAASFGDIILNSKIENSLQDLLNAMHAERGRKIFFVHINSRNTLLKQNFIENEDFFNVEDFLINKKIFNDLISKM